MRKHKKQASEDCSKFLGLILRTFKQHANCIDKHPASRRLGIFLKNTHQEAAEFVRQLKF